MPLLLVFQIVHASQEVIPRHLALRRVVEAFRGAVEGNFVGHTLRHQTRIRMTVVAIHALGYRLDALVAEQIESWKD